MKVIMILKELPRIEELGHNDKGQHIVTFDMDDVLKLVENAMYLVYTPSPAGGMAKQHAAGVGLQSLLWTCKKLFGRNK